MLVNNVISDWITLSKSRFYKPVQDLRVFVVFQDSVGVEHCSIVHLLHIRPWFLILTDKDSKVTTLLLCTVQSC